MDCLKILLVAPLSYMALLLITKLIGYRQISQLSIFDYVNGITIGSIAAEMATELEEPHKPLLAMVVYGLLVLLTSVITSHSLKARRWLTGRTLVLLENGKLYRENLKKAKLDINEFLTQCRDSGYFDLNEIQLALLETTGKVSFLPKSQQRPATPQDMGVTVQQTLPQINVVLDGHVLADNLQYLGYDETWLDRQLKAQNTTVGDCFLVTCDREGTLGVYPMNTTPMTRDLFL